MCENEGGGRSPGTLGNREGCVRKKRSEKHRQKEREGQKQFSRDGADVKKEECDRERERIQYKDEEERRNEALKEQLSFLGAFQESVFTLF